MPNCLFCYEDAGNEPYHARCAKRFFGTTTMPKLAFNQQLLKDLAEQTINKRIAVTGVQPKLSVTLDKQSGGNRLTIVGLWGEYILKPQHAELPAMPETEDLTMHLAGVFDIAVCDHSLLRAEDGSLVYLARRFDREKGNKIHVEDFCQLSEFLTENKYKGSYEKAGKLILTHCSNTGLDALRYFELLLFCFLTGNNDMHLKNFSLIHHTHSIDFSPAYDLLNVHLVFPEDKEDMALLLNGRKTKIRRRDFEALGMALQIPEKVRLNTYHKFLSRHTAIHDFIQRSFLNEEQKERYWAIWNDKCDAFQQE